MPLSIQCQKRPLNTKPNALRREGLLPTTLYGHNGTESMQLVVDKKEAALMLRDVKVNETIINVDIPDLSWKGEVILKKFKLILGKEVSYISASVMFSQINKYFGKELGINFIDTLILY